MACVLPTSFASLRHLLLALLAIGLMLRMGAACEAMAAMPQAPAAHQSHCADMPAGSDKPAKAVSSDCALCVALPDAAAPRAHPTTYVQVEPVGARSVRLTSIAGGPAPPPPKIA